MEVLKCATVLLMCFEGNKGSSNQIPAPVRIQLEVDDLDFNAKYINCKTILQAVRRSLSGLGVNISMRTLGFRFIHYGTSRGCSNLSPVVGAVGYTRGIHKKFIKEFDEKIRGMLPRYSYTK